jgi:hypothetical protein
VQIRALETETVRAGKRNVRSETASHYQRQVGEVIGWDCGEDATLSFVECSGGIEAGRGFHGRPMAMSNRKAHPR